MRIYVGNLPNGYRLSELVQLFESYACVSRVTAIRDFAFLAIFDNEGANAAINALNNAHFGENEIIVEPARFIRGRFQNGGFQGGRRGGYAGGNAQQGQGSDQNNQNHGYNQQGQQQQQPPPQGAYAHAGEGVVSGAPMQQQGGYQGDDGGNAENPDWAEDYDNQDNYQNQNVGSGNQGNHRGQRRGGRGNRRGGRRGAQTYRRVRNDGGGNDSESNQATSSTANPQNGDAAQPSNSNATRSAPPNQSQTTNENNAGNNGASGGNNNGNNRGRRGRSGRGGRRGGRGGRGRGASNQSAPPDGNNQGQTGVNNQNNQTQSTSNGIPLGGDIQNSSQGLGNRAPLEAHSGAMNQGPNFGAGDSAMVVIGKGLEGMNLGGNVEGDKEVNMKSAEQNGDRVLPNSSAVVVE